MTIGAMKTALLLLYDFSAVTSNNQQNLTQQHLTIDTFLNLISLYLSANPARLLV